jgi:hypothetical protein
MEQKKFKVFASYEFEIELTVDEENTAEDQVTQLAIDGELIGDNVAPEALYVVDMEDTGALALVSDMMTPKKDIKNNNEG